jgi:putative membrane protein
LTRRGTRLRLSAGERHAADAPAGGSRGVLHMRKAVWVVAPLLALAALAGCAVPPAPPTEAPPPAAAPPEAPPPAPAGPPTAASDQEFINIATGLNAAEIGMGRLATGKATSKEVRTFAAEMITDHTHDNRELAELAKRMNLDIKPPPDEPPPVLLTASGPDFDRHYLDLVNKSYQDQIALFESEANNGQDPRAKRLARNLLPALRHHARVAEEMAHKAGV